MRRIGLLSDTHGYLDPKIKKYFSEVDEIWHAGDIGNLETLEKLEKWKPLRVVYGNIDDHQVRASCSEILRFQVEEVQVLMMHIGGRPSKYAKKALEEISKHPAPQLFICGHSHIALAQYDKRFKMLWLNPGACGYKGFHQIKTIFRFNIVGKNIENLECIELGPRVSKITD